MPLVSSIACDLDLNLNFFPDSHSKPYQLFSHSFTLKSSFNFRTSFSIVAPAVVVDRDKNLCYWRYCNYIQWSQTTTTLPTSPWKECRRIRMRRFPGATATELSQASYFCNLGWSASSLGKESTKMADKTSKDPVLQIATLCSGTESN